MKNFILFMCIVLVYSLLLYFDRSFITTNSKIIDFLTKITLIQLCKVIWIARKNGGGWVM
jgi:hypothetical protein